MKCDPMNADEGTPELPPNGTGRFSKPRFWPRDLAHDFFLPTLLFAAIGGMVWAVRGSSGFGAMKGCIFAGVTWGTAWWFVAHDPRGPQSRRYASGWIILALTLGIGVAGAQGWTQWPAFFDGRLYTNFRKGEFVPIAKTYGFVWMFLAGVPWAGLGACLLAWCAPKRPLRAWEWFLRIGAGFGMAYFLGAYVYHRFPGIFLPLYSTLHDQYRDRGMSPNLQKLIRDNGEVMTHMGFFLGFLLFEAIRRDWKNVVLIVAVGLLNGLGWSLCQSWSWAKHIWPGEHHFNFGRAWEASAGISIGIAYGVAYFLVNRRTKAEERSLQDATPLDDNPDSQWFFALSVLALVGWAKGGWGYLYLVLSVAGFAAYAAYYFRVRDETVEQRARIWARIAEFKWLAAVVLALALGWFVRGQLPPSQAVHSGWWSHVGDFYFGIAWVYCFITVCLRLYCARRSDLSDDMRAARLAYGYPNLDWLVVFLSLLVVTSWFLRNEVTGWSGWFIPGAYRDWYGFLYVALLATFGVAFYFADRLAIRAKSEQNHELRAAKPLGRDPGLERLGACLGLILGLGLSIQNGLRGWANDYPDVFAPHNDRYWSEVFWRVMGPLMLIALFVALLWTFVKRIPRDSQNDLFPHAYRAMWLVLIVQNLIAQFVTGPYTHWTEAVFNIFYGLLFLIAAVTVYHYGVIKALRSPHEFS